MVPHHTYPRLSPENDLGRQFPSGPAVHNTFGVLLLSTFLSLMYVSVLIESRTPLLIHSRSLYGVALHQLKRYCGRYLNSDRTIIQIFVFAAVVMESLLSLVCVHACYHYLIANKSQSTLTIRGVWSFYAISPLVISTMFITQVFFAHRVYLLKPKCLPLVVISLSCSLTALGLSIASSTRSIQAETRSGFMDPSSYVLLDAIAMGAVVIADTLTASVLVIVLKRSQTGLPRAERIIDRLVLYSINTGLATVLLDFLAIALAIAYPDDLYDFAIAMISAKVYANSILAMLNARESLTRDLERTYQDELFNLGPLRLSIAAGDEVHADQGTAQRSIQQSHEPGTNAPVANKHETLGHEAA
ncbi:hypothetical protein C8Q77DRAFT_1121869 [Trametes polyzona]|nr:hypothetical protein C8Q77DRAFT_1121869 [Trametes polyzona]